MAVELVLLVGFVTMLSNDFAVGLITLARRGWHVSLDLMLLINLVVFVGKGLDTVEILVPLRLARIFRQGYGRL